MERKKNRTRYLGEDVWEENEDKGNVKVRRGKKGEGQGKAREV